MTKEYWDNRWKNNDTGWDIGHVSTPLKEYIDQLEDKNVQILIPGGGNAYEAEYLHSKGFANVHLLDISPAPLENFLGRVPSFPREHLLCRDLFDHQGEYDLILEQTFFCAIDPAFRGRYVEHMHGLLRPSGKLVGVLFNDRLNDDKPPFGGNTEEYRKLFEERFRFRHFETAYNSIAPRAGRELFIHLERIDARPFLH
jgi:methyl halide transferase